MLSKFLRFSYKPPVTQLFRKGLSPKITVVRYSTLIPASQYDIPISNKFRLGYVVRTYWETIPLFFCTFFALGVLFAAILWSINNKVDVVYTTHSRENISRTMNLRQPTVHKVVIINQKYEPWPEMQDVLDKMALAEKRALVRATACSLP